MENLLNIKKLHQQVTTVVEECLETDLLTEKHLEEICQFLDNSSLKNVSEERFLSKKCGYPLCINKLNAVKEQKYKIHANRVFDVTDRQYFCSDYCYESFLHLAEQLPTEPFWISGPRKRFSVDFLKRNKFATKKKVISGIEIDLDPTLELIKAVEELKILDDSEKKILHDSVQKPKISGKIERTAQEPTPKIKSVQMIDVSRLNHDTPFLDDDDELDEILSIHSTLVDEESDPDDRQTDVNMDNLCGWSSKTDFRKHSPSERNLDIIRKKYFVDNNKKGLSLKKRPPPIYIEPKPFPKNVTKKDKENLP